MTTIGKLTVMQAFLDGKQIQCKSKADPDTYYRNISGEPLWNWESSDYRVRPEPMEIRVWVKPDGHCILNAFGMSYMEGSQYTLKTFVEKGDSST